MISPLFKRINGLDCSAYYILDHIRYGLSPSYPSNANEWPGISGIKGRLTYANSQISFVEIEIKYLKAENVSETCLNKYGVENDRIILNEIINSSFEIDFEEQIDNLDDALMNFDDADIDIWEDIYDTMHD